MNKIADASELERELLSLLAYAQTERPSRSRIAGQLQHLSNRLATYKGDGEKFYDLMKEEWDHVKYDPKTGRGEARIGLLGMIHWNESGSDPAVVLTIDKFPRIKARADDALKALEKIRDAVANAGV